MTTPNHTLEPTRVGAFSSAYAGLVFWSRVAQLLSLGIAMRVCRFPDVYQRSVRWAFICQVVGFVLTGMILDTGIFALQFLVLSLVFWVLVGIVMFARHHPTLVERALIGSGPALIFLIGFCIG